MSDISQAILIELAALGIRVEAVGDKLRLIPKKTIPAELMDRIKANKSALLAHLESKTPSHPTSKTPTNRVVEVSEVPDAKEPAANESSEFQSLQSWCLESSDRPSTTDPFGLTRVIVFAPVNPMSDPTILAQVSLVFADLIVVHGIMIERRGANRVSVRYPRVDCIGGIKVDLLCPFARGALDELESRIIAEARKKGFALITPEPRDELRSTLESAQDGEAT